jgi:hypothetical protein
MAKKTKSASKAMKDADKMLMSIRKSLKKAAKKVKTDKMVTKGKCSNGLRRLL